MPFLVAFPAAAAAAAVEEGGPPPSVLGEEEQEERLLCPRECGSPREERLRRCRVSRAYSQAAAPAAPTTPEEQGPQLEASPISHSCGRTFQPLALNSARTFFFRGGEGAGGDRRAKERKNEYIYI